MDAGVAFVVVYFSALPVAVVALLAALVLWGRWSRVTTGMAVYATGVPLLVEVYGYLSDAAERAWQPAWYVGLVLLCGAGTLAILVWSLVHPPGRSGGVPAPDRGWRLTLMFAGHVAAIAYAVAVPALYMLYVSPG